MARLLAGALIVLGLIIGAFTLTPADAQDNTEGRLSALETQVADLTMRVELLEGGTPTGTEGSQTLTGTVTGVGILRDQPQSAKHITADCAGTGGYSDLAPGAPVTVKDEQGNIVGNSSLGAGTVIPFSPDARYGNDCQFTFEVSGLPNTGFYTIEIGQRDGVTYSLDDLVDADWHIDLTIGQ